MKDIPLPVEALNDVLPGSPWQPEHAARYNALNALLRQEDPARPAAPAPSRGSEVLLPVRNITDEPLPGGQAVEICPDPQPGLGVYFQRPMLFGRAVTAECRFWGIATENIAPGRGGLVQVGGPAAVYGVEGSPDRYIVPKPDGGFCYSTSGRAEVLYYNPQGYGSALVYLGGGGSSGYTGMFAVRENSDGTVTVGGGMMIKSYYEFPITVEEATLQRPATNSYQQFVLLVVELRGAHRIYFSIENGYGNEAYIPGEQICWTLARLSKGNIPFAQLWQGGMIDFTSKYYLS